MLALSPSMHSGTKYLVRCFPNITLPVILECGTCFYIYSTFDYTRDIYLQYKNFDDRNN